MQYLIISDIHANYVALSTVLTDAPEFDKILCLGDLVGYGPSPNRCIDRMREYEHINLAGNHDWATLGKLDLRAFNQDARQANLWTRSNLTPESRRYLSSLLTRQEVESFTLVHASPREPVWEYILDSHVACVNFDHFSTPICLVGHTHVPTVFELDQTEDRCEPVRVGLEEPLSLESRRLIINPGSVGQPRDGDPRASYAMLDTAAMTFTFRRVAYSIEITQERMRARGLPSRLIDRLAAGR